MTNTGLSFTKGNKKSDVTLVFFNYDRCPIPYTLFRSVTEGAPGLIEIAEPKHCAVVPLDGAAELQKRTVTYNIGQRENLFIHN